MCTRWAFSTCTRQGAVCAVAAKGPADAMRPCANGMFLTACVFIVLSFVPMTLQGAGKKKTERQGVSDRVVSKIKYCNPERCRRLCIGLRNFEEGSVNEAYCKGVQCVCSYNLACNLSDCYQKCAREKFVALSRENGCVTRECFCLYEDRCEKRNCAEGCPGVKPKSDGVKGVCVGSGCSCRWT